MHLDLGIDIHTYTSDAYYACSYFRMESEARPAQTSGAWHRAAVGSARWRGGHGGLGSGMPGAFCHQE